MSAVHEIFDVSIPRALMSDCTMAPVSQARFSGLARMILICVWCAEEMYQRMQLACVRDRLAGARYHRSGNEKKHRHVGGNSSTYCVVDVLDAAYVHGTSGQMDLYSFVKLYCWIFV